MDVSSFFISDSGGPGDRRSGVFKVEELDAVRRQTVRRYQNSQCRDTLGGHLWRNLGLWTVFFNCQICRISRVSVSRLKEFYCNQTSKNVNLNISCQYKILMFWVTAPDRAALNLVTTASTLCFLIIRRPIRSSQFYIKLSSPMQNSIQGNIKGWYTASNRHGYVNDKRMMIMITLDTTSNNITSMTSYRTTNERCKVTVENNDHGIFLSNT